MKTTIKNKLHYYLNENVEKFIVYHGSDIKFNVFNDDKPIFFTNNKSIARTYGDYIIKAEIELRNPLIFDFENKSTYYFYDKWYIPSQLAIKIKEISEDIKNHYIIEDDLKTELEYLGYDFNYIDDLDGIVMENIVDANDGVFSKHESATNYVVFDKKQIKIILNESYDLNENKFIRVFHGTKKKFVDDIYKNGLEDKSMNYQQGWYMVATDFESALFHADAEENDFAYVFEFKIPVENNTRWLGFPYLWKGMIRNDNSTWYALKQPIPPEFIIDLHKIPYDKWLKQKSDGF